MAVVKHIPERQCCGCGMMFPKKDLVRVVREADGTVSLDLTGKKSGRGAYVCRKAECLKKARKTRKIERTLAVDIPPELFDAMEKELENE